MRAAQTAAANEIIICFKKALLPNAVAILKLMELWQQHWCRCISHTALGCHALSGLGQLPPATEAAAATWLARVRCTARHPAPRSLR